jgi:hypothetical protein
MKGLGRKLALGLVTVLALLLVIALAAWWRLDRFLGGDDCRRLAARAVENVTGVPGEFMPLVRTGGALFSEGYEGRGGAVSPVARLRADQVRAELNMRSLFSEAFRVEQVVVQRVRVDLQRPVPGAVAETRVERTQSRNIPATAALLPRRVEIGVAAVRDFNVTWPSGVSDTGRVEGVQVTLTPVAGVIDVVALGGVVAESGLPRLRLEELKARLNGHALYLSTARLRSGERGVVTADGELTLDARPRIAVTGSFKDMPVSELVAGDWRARLHGSLDGTFRWNRGTGDAASVIAGHADVKDGRIEALPVLDDIATFTKTEEFRSVKLDRASADFVWTSDGLTVTNLIMEARGLLRVEGSVVLRGDGRLEGTLEVGTTAPRLAALPGAETQVFTGSRDGYIWAVPALRLSGTGASPKEDLSPRLRVAAVEAIRANLQDAVQRAPEKAKDAIKQGLDLFDTLLK